jgi:hypothetical protein
MQQGFAGILWNFSRGSAIVFQGFFRVYSTEAFARFPASTARRISWPEEGGALI